MKELSSLQINLLKVERANRDHERATKTKREAHAFLWQAFDSICGRRVVYEKDKTLYSLNDPDYSQEDAFIRKLLGLQDQKEPISLSLRIERGFNRSAFSIKLETKEGDVADRQSIIFQITKYGTDQEPIWETRMFVEGVDNSEEVSIELNQPNKSFKRLENGLHLLNFISN